MQLLFSGVFFKQWLGLSCFIYVGERNWQGQKRGRCFGELSRGPSASLLQALNINVSLVRRRGRARFSSFRTEHLGQNVVFRK